MYCTQVCMCVLMCYRMIMLELLKSCVGRPNAFRGKNIKICKNSEYRDRDLPIGNLWL